MINKAAIVIVAPHAAPYADELLRQMADVGITTPRRAAHFLGQIYVESGGFETVVESLNYSADSLKRLFGRHRITESDADKFGRTKDHPANQNALANILYGGAFGREQLGNTDSGDGWIFRGRGLKQLTGRDNYTRFSKAWLGTDEAVNDPDIVALPRGAVASAIWFWRANGLNEIADTGSVEAVTRKVNGGLNGIAERRKWTGNFLKAFGGI